MNGTPDTQLASSFSESLSKQDTPDDIAVEREALPEPIEVIPLDGSRDSENRWSLVVPPASAKDKVVRHLNNLRTRGDISLPADLAETLAMSAVYPAVLAQTPIKWQRVDDGWFAEIETRVFTLLADISLANDRWVADAKYDADPNAMAGATSGTFAVPLPTSDAEYAALVYTADTKHLVTAADHNFQQVLATNRQNVGRRLIEQPITLVPTIVRPATTSAQGDMPTSVSSFVTADGNCRASSALDNIKVLVEWLPESLQKVEPYRSLERGTLVTLVPSLLMNLTVTDRRSLTRKVAKRASDRLALPKKSTADRGYKKDLLERNEAAATLNSLTTPARVVVGWKDDDPSKHGMSRFAPAVRSLLVQMNVEGEPLTQQAQHAITAEEIVTDLLEEDVITSDQASVLIGRDGVSAAMTRLNLNPARPDLRAAYVVQVLTGGDRETRRVMRARIKGSGQLHYGDRSAPAVELALRSYSVTLSEDENRDLRQIRNALESGCTWQDLVTRTWTVENIDTDEDVDVLCEYARDQRETGGTSLRLLGVLGMFALVTTGNLLTPGGSASARVGAEVDRTSVGQIVDKISRHEWGITLLADAVKRSRAGLPLRWISEDGDLIEAPADWSGADFNANLRLAAKERTTRAAIIPGNMKERNAWTAFAEAVTSAKAAYETYMEYRNDNGTTKKLAWTEVEASVRILRALAGRTVALSDEPLENF